jgi:hypothetical protein
VDQGRAGRNTARVALIQLRKTQWQWRWLEEVGDALPPTWQPFYDELAKTVGSQQTSTLEEEGGHQSWPGALSVEAYKAMPLDQFIDELQSSAAESGGRTAGLLPLLSTLISDTPTRFVEQADLFQEQSPEVVTAALRGFTQAIIGKHSFDWSYLLSLCAWTIEQRFLSIEEEEGSPRINPAWAEASKEVSVLLETTFRLSRASLSPAWQETLWSMLAALVNDTYGLVQQPAGREPPPAWSLVLNSTRGQALLASIEYAQWVWEDWQSDRRPQDAEEEQWTLGQVPEVRLLLERFLVPGQDDTGVVHAVLGHMFPLLFYLDEQWTTQHQQAIFPHDEASRSSFEAAWESFLLQAPPSRKVLEVLRGEYSLAISHMQSNDGNQHFYEEPDARLAFHLAIFVIRGDIATRPADPLVVQFFQRASEELRHRVVSEIGRILANEKEPLPEQAVEHSQHFWEWRMAQVSALPDPHQSAHELAAFGWWVFKGIFPAHWSVEQLARVLEWSERLDMSSFVVHRLAELVSQEPVLTLQCLSRLVEGDTSSWGSAEWNEGVKTILVEALQQQDEAIRARARAVMSVLMMQGHTQYRELVSHSEYER